MLKSEGCRGVYVEIATTNRDALDFYSRLGFADLPSLKNIPDEIVVLGRTIWRTGICIETCTVQQWLEVRGIQNPESCFIILTYKNFYLSTKPFFRKKGRLKCIECQGRSLALIEGLRLLSDLWISIFCASSKLRIVHSISIQRGTRSPSSLLRFLPRVVEKLRKREFRCYEIEKRW